MKNPRGLLATLTALCLSISALMPIAALGKSIDDYEVVSSSFNKSAVQNDPEYYATFSLEAPLQLDAITVYHYNNGNGAVPGTITLYDNETDQKLYTWDAVGRDGNKLWTAYPDVVLPMGKYYVEDSDPKTMSWNSQAPGGMVELRGHWFAGDGKPVETDTSSSSSSSATTSDKMQYIHSDWAYNDINRAVTLGIIPDSFNGEDLSRGCTRAEFAAVAVKAYEKMSGASLSAGSNPFTDSSDPYVLKAYNANIVAGTSASTFSPNNTLTREQAAAMLTRAYKKTIFTGWSLDNDYALEYSATSQFADYNEIRPYARESVGYLSSKGVISGVGNNMFAPENTLTKEQAIAIAVRMTDKLDMTKREGKEPVTEVQTQATTATSVSGSGDADVKPASGDVSVGGATVSFGTKGKGEVLISNEGRGKESLSDKYLFAFSDEQDSTVKLSVKCDDPKGKENQLAFRIGVPYVDSKGKEGTLYSYVNATYNNGTASTDINISEYSGELAESVNTSSVQGSAGFKSNLNTYTSNVLKRESTKGHIFTFKNGLQGKGFFAEVTVLYTYTSSRSSHFSVQVDPLLTLNDRYYMDDEGYEHLLDDAESILQQYQTMGYPIVRDKWPMPIIMSDLLETEVFGLYYGMTVNSGSVTLGVANNLPKTYRKGGTFNRDDELLYRTLSHELFHFIQRNMNSKLAATTWIDEMTAVYMEQEMGDKVSTLATNSNVYSGSGNWRYMYMGLLPSGLYNSDGGYGRRPFAYYLANKNPNFIKSLYTSAAVSNDTLVSASGESYETLAFNVYKELTTSDRLKAVNNAPWDIAKSSDLQRGSFFDFDIVHPESFDGSTKTVSAKAYPYGVSYIAMDLGNIPGDCYSFNVDGGGFQPLVIYYNKDSYDSIQTFGSGETSVKSIPIKGGHYLIMLANNINDTREDSVIVTFNRHGAANSASSFSFSTKGDMSYSSNGKGNDAKGEGVVTVNDGHVYIDIASDDGGYVYSTESASYNPATGLISGSGVSGYVKYSSSSTHEEETTNAFDTSSLGSGTVYRIHVKGSDGLEAVFDSSFVSGLNLQRSDEQGQTTVNPDTYDKYFK